MIRHRSPSWLVLVRVLVLAASVLASCSATPGSTPGATAPPPPQLTPVAELPPEPAAIPDADLAGDFACGPFRTADLGGTEKLLDDRVNVRFFSGAASEGGRTAGKVEVTLESSRLFFGARETYTAGDAAFTRRAAKLARFGGGYDPVMIRSDGGSIVAGVVRDVPPDRELVSLAHGWMLDDERNVIDVALFVTPGAITDLQQCRRFAQKLLATTTLGSRRLVYGSPGEVETTASYATFRYRLPPEWMMTSAEGIHDFSHIRFRRRGIFPHDSVELALGLDSHPGDPAPEGVADGSREGRVLGLPLTWKLTRDTRDGETRYGGSGVSVALAGHDHAIGAFQWANSPAERDEAIRFAESVALAR